MSESKRYVAGYGNVRTSYAYIAGVQWEIANLRSRNTYVIWIENWDDGPKQVWVPYDQLESIVDLLRSGAAL